jgi:sulfatase modifying factor 1
VIERPSLVLDSRLLTLSCFEFAVRALACGLVSLVISSCNAPGKKPDSERSPPETKPTSAPTELYLPLERAEGHSFDVRKEDDNLAENVTFGPSGEESLLPTEASGNCPPEMVAIEGGYCIDRFEATMVDSRSGRSLSPHYPPTREYTVSLYERWVKQAPSSERAMGREIPVPAPPFFQLHEQFAPRARSQRGSIPAGYLSRTFAETACRNAGKRLCSRDEWVQACRGEQGTKFPYGDEYRQGACNVHRESHPARLLHGDASQNHKDPRLGLSYDEDGPLLLESGSKQECISRWGGDAVYDMVGNLDEWIEDPAGAFLGGFFSRATRSGCDASIDSHAPSYFDYSLGTRCCQSQ